MTRARHILPMVVALVAAPMGVCAATTLSASLVAGCMADHGFAPGSRLAPADQAAVQSCAQARAGMVVQTDAPQAQRAVVLRMALRPAEPCALEMTGGAGYRCATAGGNW